MPVKVYRQQGLQQDHSQEIDQKCQQAPMMTNRRQGETTTTTTAKRANFDVAAINVLLLGFGLQQ